VLLGVLGLVSLSLAKRTKEIGIRKVLGASIIQINVLFLKEFIILIVLANLIAWPLTYWLMNDWLQNFAYKISLGIVDFIWVAIFVMLLTVILICIQTSRAAMLNPVKSLRND
jgi:putative ABC transport system permease protein